MLLFNPKIFIKGLITCVVISLTSCGDSALSKKFPDACWGYDMPLSFPITLSENTQGILVEVVFEEDYSYSNLYLDLTLTSPSGQEKTLQATETFVDPLGNWAVPADGKTYAYQFSSFAAIDGMENGTYTAELVQAMRDDPLCHIKKVVVRNSTNL